MTQNIARSVPVRIPFSAAPITLMNTMRPDGDGAQCKPTSFQLETEVYNFQTVHHWLYCPEVCLCLRLSLFSTDAISAFTSFEFGAVSLINEKLSFYQSTDSLILKSSHPQPLDLRVLCKRMMMPIQLRSSNNYSVDRDSWVLQRLVSLNKPTASDSLHQNPYIRYRDWYVTTSSCSGAIY